MFLPEIYMYLQTVQLAPFDAPPDPGDDEQAGRPSTPDADERDCSESVLRANEWDEWKSVRDVA